MRARRASATRGGEPARRAVERWGATLLRDGSAVAELKFGSKEWIVGEVLALARRRGRDRARRTLRRELRDRAKTLAQELGVSRLRVEDASNASSPPTLPSATSAFRWR